MSITRVNEFQSAPGKGDELFAFLTSLVPYICSSEGCLSVDVLRGHDVADCFIVIEKWRSIDAHTTSVKNFPKQEMHAATPLFGAPPKGGYYTS